MDHLLLFIFLLILAIGGGFILYKKGWFKIDNRPLTFVDSIHASVCTVISVEDEGYPHYYRLHITNGHMSLFYTFQFGEVGKQEKIEMVIRGSHQRTLEAAFLDDIVIEWRLNNRPMSPDNYLALRSFDLFQILKDVRDIASEGGYR